MLQENLPHVSPYLVLTRGGLTFVVKGTFDQVVFFYVKMVRLGFLFVGYLHKELFCLADTSIKEDTS